MLRTTYENHSYEEEAVFYLELSDYDVQKAYELYKKDLNFESKVY